MKGLTTGRIVHYVRSCGAHFPAMIVKIYDYKLGMIALIEFSDEQYPHTILRTSVNFDENKNLNTWHWIEPA